jgi:hypothetical protein
MREKKFSPEADMSCWVVPEIAADLWGIPLEQVLERISDGSVPTKREGDFVFVDVKPQLAMSYDAGSGENVSTVTFVHPRWESSRGQIALLRHPPRAA